MVAKLIRITEKVLGGLNHDFCPWANRYVYWLKRPVGWVVCGIAASILVGLFIGPQGYVLTGAFAALLVLGVAWPWLSLMGMGCRIILEESRSEENKPTHVTLEVTNRWPVPAFGLMVSGQFLQNLVHEDDRIAIALRKVPAWSVSRFEWPIEPKRRGVLPVGIPELSTGFPFDLTVVSKPIEFQGQTIVWPACTPLDGVPDLGGSQFNIDGVSSTRAGNDGETIGAREYRHGDAIKNIHWSRTSQFNKLIVRERQSFTQSPIRVVVDLIPQNHRGLGQESTYECAIRVAASVVKQLHVHHSRIELVFVGLPEGVPNRVTNRNGLSPLLDFLARLPVHDESKRVAANKYSIPTDDQFTVLICTQSFEVNTQPSKRLLQITIDAEHFANQGTLEELPCPLPAAITTPELASEQLSQCWLEGVHA